MQPSESESFPATITLANLGTKSAMCVKESVNALAGQSVYQSDIDGAEYAHHGMPLDMQRGVDENDLFVAKQRMERKLKSWRDSRSKARHLKKEEED